MLIIRTRFKALCPVCGLEVETWAYHRHPDVLHYCTHYVPGDKSLCAIGKNPVNPAQGLKAVLDKLCEE